MEEHFRAFRLYVYESEDGREKETIWNSRSGDVPLVVLNRGRSQNIRVKSPDSALREPLHVPPVGARIHVTLPYDVAADMARLCLKQKLSTTELPEEKIQELAKHLYAEGRMPYLVVVDAALHQVFLEKKESASP